MIGHFIYVYRAKRALELFKMDQENLRLKIKEWEANNPESTFFFRPYITVEAESEHLPSGQVPKEEKKTEVKNMEAFQGNSGDDYWCEVLRPDKHCSQTFLYVYTKPVAKEIT